MDSWRLSLNLIRTLPAVGLSMYSINVLAMSPVDGQTNNQPGSLSSNSNSSSDNSLCSTAQDLNTCAPRLPMRALSPDEIKIVMGANYTTDPNYGTSHGGCSSAGCHVTASPPPSSGVSFLPSSPPPSSPPPQDSGGGDGGDFGVPNQFPASAVAQQHLENCAKVYGTSQPSSNFTTKFTQEYGFQSLSITTGLNLQNAVEPTDNPPATIPAGGEAWRIIGGATNVSGVTSNSVLPYETDLYMYAYPKNSTAVTVGVISHEWYHQQHDMPGETDKQRGDYETAAKAAGKAAQVAYEQDNGAKCAGL